MASKPQALPLTHTRPTAPCTVCGKADAKACGRCCVDYYCGKQHQTQDWPRHKAGCGVVEMRRDDRLGRHLVATRDIPAGTTIMREMALLIWPRPQAVIEGYRTLCVGCCKMMPPSEAKSCQRCGWPVCNAACGQRPEHQAECAAFQRAKFKLTGAGTQKQWFTLAAIRMALAASQDPTLKARLMEMQSGMPGAQNYNEQAPDFISSRLRVEKDIADLVKSVEKIAIKRMGLSWLSAKELRRWSGVIRFNCFTLTPHTGAAGLYAGGTVFEHACVPNVAFWALGEDFKTLQHNDAEHMVATTRDVAKGEHLAISYGELPFDWRLERWLTLANTWCFHCVCELCSDPTDRGLNVAAWYCGACQGRGAQHLVVLDDWCESWRCEGCGRTGAARGAPGEIPNDDPNRTKAYTLGERLSALQDRLARGEEVPLAEWESFLSDSLWPRGPLHSTNQLILKAKREMIHHEPFLHLQSPDACARMRGYCRDLLAAVDMLCPGHLLYKSHVMKRMQMHLANHIARVTMSYVSVANGSSSLLLVPQLRQELQDLKREWKELYPDMKRCAVAPFEKKALEGVVQTLNGHKLTKMD